MCTVALLLYSQRLCVSYCCWSSLSVTVEAQILALPESREVRMPHTEGRRLPCPSRLELECAAQSLPS